MIDNLIKRKEQSQARLVKQIQTICDFINNRPEIFKGIYGGVDKIITEYAERKEQECEELKKMNETGLQQWVDMYNKADKERFEALLQRDRYKQALDEIEKYLDAQQQFFNGEDYHNLLGIINKTKE